MAQAGDHYFQVTGWVGDEGNLVFNVGVPTPPANDDFANATVVGTTPFTDTVSTLAAGDEPGESTPGCGTSRNSVWYTYTHATSGSTAPLVDLLTADTFGSTYDTVLAVYEGTSLASLVEVACNDDAGGLQSRVNFTPQVGSTYYFQVTGFFGEEGTAVFNLNADEDCVPQVANLLGSAVCT